MTDAPTEAMTLRGLSKEFDGRPVVTDLSLGIPAGSMYGLVGPNGAGKTTTLSMATGLLRPTGGTAAVFGHDVWTDPAAAKALMGVLPDGLRTFDRLSGRELLLYTGRLRRVPEAELAGRAEELLAALYLTGDADRIVADYSAGMRKKILLACALVHGPRLVVLDEPFEAVDPVSGQVIRGILHDVVAAGGTVVLSSHVMELVETLCDGVAVVAGGRIRAAGPLDAVRDGMSLQERFLALVGAPARGEGGLSWLRPSSD